ncbi:MAG: penicillin-binding transpeptidase domain-containing protein [Pyrinomonadaceae bacterium]
MKKRPGVLLFGFILIIISLLISPSIFAAKTSKSKTSKVLRSASSHQSKSTGKSRSKSLSASTHRADSSSRSRSRTQVARRVISRRSTRGSRNFIAVRGRRGQHSKHSRRLTRRQLEALRRAEAARRAAIARQRAFEESLRQETALNIQKDITAGEDLEVRRIAISALGSHAGTVVAMDPMTGRVYTVVNQEWAVRRGFKPCSTVKLVTGLAGLNEGVINPVQTIEVSAGGSHELDLTDALAYSNNGFFQSIGSQVGFEKMMQYGRMLGLGEVTGINHPNEYPGRLPFLKSGYQVNHMSSHGDDIEVTPIQLATMVSAIVNGGTLLTPHMPRTTEESGNFKTEVRREINVPRETLMRLIPGMIGAVNYGTGHRAYSATETIGGKTGTCIGQGSWLGLFGSAAPIENPRLAISVVLRGSGERGRSASDVAGKIYRALSSRFGHANDPNAIQMAKTPNELIPHSKITAAEAAAISDEDKEADSAEEAAADSQIANPSTQQVNGTSQAGSVKKVIMPVVPKASPDQKGKPAAAPTINSQASPNSDRRAPVSPPPVKNKENDSVNDINNAQRPRRTTTAPTTP